MFSLKWNEDNNEPIKLEFPKQTTRNEDLYHVPLSEGIKEGDSLKTLRVCQQYAVCELSANTYNFFHALLFLPFSIFLRYNVRIGLGLPGSATLFLNASASYELKCRIFELSASIIDDPFT